MCALCSLWFGKAFVFQTEHSVQCIRDPKFCNVFQWGIFLNTYLISYIHCMAIHAACVRIFNIFSSNNCNPEHKFHIMPPSRYKTHDTFFFYSFWQSTVVVHNLAHKPNSSTLSHTCSVHFGFIVSQFKYLIFSYLIIEMLPCTIPLMVRVYVSDSDAVFSFFLLPINLLHFDLPWDTEWLWRISKSVPYWALIAYVAMHEHIKGEQLK